MADTTIDLKLYLSGTSAVEQGLLSVHNYFKKTEKLAADSTGQMQACAKAFTETFAAMGRAMDNLGFGHLVEGGEAVSQKLTDMAASTAQLNAAFAVLTGRSLSSVILSVQQLTVHYGAGATATYLLGTATTSLAGALQVLGAAAAIAGAAFVGWQVGKLINDMELFGVKIGDFVAYRMLYLLEIWERVKRALFLTSKEEFAAQMEGIEQSRLEFAGASGKKAPEKTESPEDAERRRAMQAEQLARTQAEAAQRLRTAVLQKDQAVLENLYAQDKVTFDEYVKAKREMALRETKHTLEEMNKRTEELKAQVKPLESRATKGDASAEEPLARLKLEMEKVTGEIKVLEEEKTRKMTELDTWESQQRKIHDQQLANQKKKEEEAAAQKKEREEKLSADIQKEFLKATDQKLELLKIEENERKAQINNEIKDEKLKAEALTALAELYAKKRKDLRDQEAAEIAKKKISEIELETKTQNEALEEKKRKLQNDFRLTNRQKMERELELLKETLRVNEALTEQMEEQAKAARGKGHEEAAKQYDAQAERFRGRARSARGSLRDKQEQPDPNSIRDQMTEVFVEMQNQMQTLAENIATMFKDIVNTAIDSTAESIEGLIHGTMTWSQALQNIGDSILNQIISSFARMAAQWIVNQILMWTVGKALGAASLATTAPMASAAAGMWAAPALLASISSYGSAVGAGQAALTAGLAANQASAKAFSSSGGIMAAEGGLITGPGTGTSDSIPALLSNGEFVIPAKRVEEFGSGFFEGIRNGAVRALDIGASARDGKTAVPSINLAAAAPKVNVQSAQPKVIVVNSQEELMRVMKGSIGEEIMVSHIAKNKMRLGMAS